VSERLWLGPGTPLKMRLLGLAGVLLATTCGVQGRKEAEARSGLACVSVVPAHVTQVMGLPPHQSWPGALPNTPHHDWVPFNADKEHVLLAWLGLGRRTGTSHTPLATVTRNERLTPIPKREYPHYNLGRMRMEYPWIVGMRYTQQPPDDWVLWAANVVTGRLLTLDHGNGNGAKTTRQFPDFDLNAHRVIWNNAAFPAVQSNPASHRSFLWNRLDLYNLDRRTKPIVSFTTDGRSLYMQPTLWGRQVVAVRVTEPVGPDINPTNDLVLINLDSGKVTNLTQNHNSGVSTEPSLWEHYLLFKQSGTPYSEGDIVLWDLSKGPFPLWRRPGAAVLEPHVGEMPVWDGGVAWWQAQRQATVAVYLPGTGRVWTFQYGPHVDLPQYYKYTWTISASGQGRTIVVERDAAGTRYAPTYYVWQFPMPSATTCN
jgi:hypothetical protein